MKTKKFFGVLMIFALLFAAMPVMSAAAKPASKVDICHKTGNGTFILISISNNALTAHVKHGDAKPGSLVTGMPGKYFSKTCDVVQSVKVSTSPLVFGPNGWAGMSCPAGYTVISGGYEPAGLTVAKSYAAVPGAPLYPVFPHYTFSPGETGWVVQNINTSQTLSVYAICLPN